MFTCLPALFYAMTGGGGPGAFQRFQGFGVRYMYNGTDIFNDDTSPFNEVVRGDIYDDSTLLFADAIFITVGASNYVTNIMGKVLADGTLAWSTSLSISASKTSFFTVTPLRLANGNYIAFSDRSTNNTYAAIINGADGTISTQVRFQGESGRVARNAIELPSGNILFFGTLNSYNYGTTTRPTCMVTVTNSLLGYVSSRAFIGTTVATISSAYGVSIPPVPGQVWNTPGAWLSMSSNGTGQALGVYAVKIDNSGNIITQTTYGPEPSFIGAEVYECVSEYSTATATPAGDFIFPFQHSFTEQVTGGQLQPFELVVAYVNPDGSKKWATALTPAFDAAFGSDQPEDAKIVTDSAGDVYAVINTYSVVGRTGATLEDEVNYSVDFVKLSGVNGNLIWKKRFRCNLNGQQVSDFSKNTLQSGTAKIITVSGQERLQVALSGGGTGNSLATAFLASLDTLGTPVEVNANELVEIPCTLTPRAFTGTTTDQVSITTVDRTANSSIISATGYLEDLELSVAGLTGLTKTPAFTYS